MRISRIKISNFANFSDFEVATGNSLVIVGENARACGLQRRSMKNLLFPAMLVSFAALAAPIS